MFARVRDDEFATPAEPYAPHIARVLFTGLSDKPWFERSGVGAPDFAIPAEEQKAAGGSAGDAQEFTISLTNDLEKFKASVSSVGEFLGAEVANVAACVIAARRLAPSIEATLVVEKTARFKCSEGEQAPTEQLPSIKLAKTADGM